MNTHGFVPLWMRVDNYISKAKFLVGEQLPVALILGAQSIDSNFSVTRHEDQTVTLVDGPSAPLVRLKTVRITLYKPAGLLFRIATTQEGPKCISNRVVTVEPIRLPPNSQTFAKLMTG